MVPRLTWTLKIDSPSTLQILQQPDEVAPAHLLDSRNLATEHFARCGFWVGGDADQNIRGELDRIIEMARIGGIEKVVHRAISGATQNVQRQVVADFVAEGCADRRRMMRGIEIDEAALVPRLRDFLNRVDIKSPQRHPVALG